MFENYFNFTALCILAGAAFLFLLFRKNTHSFVPPNLRFPSIHLLELGKAKARWQRLPALLLSTALASFAIAWIDPHFFIDHPQSQLNPNKNPASYPVEGIGIYFILDQSGSMIEEIDVGGRRKTRKIDMLKQVTRQFIEGDPQQGLKGRPNDMVGLVFFARAARIQAPLTLDHEAVLKQLAMMDRVIKEDDDGTSIGYAIYKTANIIAATKQYAEELSGKGLPSYSIKNTVMILVTDGMQDPNPLDKGKRLRNMDVPEAAAYAKEQGIKLYIVNVEPKLSTEEFAPYRHIMQKAASVTGGKFFMVESNGSLPEIYQEIDRLEKSSLPEEAHVDANKENRPDLYLRISLYSYFIVFGLVALASACLLETVLLRRVP